jgi:tetratricopeptide (TPR) repeat protein
MGLSPTELYARFRETGDRAALDQAAVAARTVVDELAVTGDGRLPRALSNLAMILNKLAEITDDDSLTDEAIDISRRALAALAADDPDRPAMASNLGFELLGRFRATNDPAVLDEAIALCRQGVDKSAADDPHLRVFWSNLAVALGLRAESTGDLSAAAAAVDADRAAIAATPDDHPDLARLHSNLQGSLTRHATLAGDPALLAEAITAGEDGLRRTPSGDPQRPGRLMSLANARQQLAQASRSVDELRQAVDLARQAAEAMPGGHRDRPTVLINLSIKLRLLHAAQGNLADLRESVETGREAVGALRGDHPDRVPFQANHGLALFDLYQVTGESRLLDEAARAQRAAAAEAPPGLLRARVNTNLCGVLHALYHRSGRPELLDEAIEAARAAVADAPDGHPQRANALSRLGICLRSAYRRGDAPELLAEAVAVTEQAVDAAFPADRPFLLSNLALIMVPSGARPEPAVLARAAAIAREAVAALPAAHPELAAARATLVSVLLAGPDRPDALAEACDEGERAALTGNASIRVRVRAAQLWGRAAMRAGDRAAGVKAYRTAVDLLAELVPGTLDRNDREFGLGDISGLPGEAAAAALTAGLPASAVELLERSRGVLLGQVAEAGTPPGGRPVVILNAAPTRCDAIVLTGDSADPVWHVDLPGVTEELVMTQANRLLELTGPAADPAPSFAAYRRLRQDALGILGWQWDAVVAPVLDRLRPAAESRLWWSPVGAMAFLPWHAAGHHPARDGRTVLDRVISSYAPTVRALDHARRPLGRILPPVVIGAST